MKGISKYWNKISSHSFLPILVASPAIFFSCQEPDPFPIIPEIQFNNIQFVELLENGNPDSLILSFDFQDGDGDLGVEGDETFPPFHDFNFVVDNNNRIVTFGQEDVELPFYLFVPDPFQPTRSLFSETDNRPSFDCGDYDTLYINEEKDRYIPPGVSFGDIDLEVFQKDTVYIQRNPYKSNIIIKFFRKRGIEEYEEIDWRYLTSQYGCGISFDGRFPVLDFETVSSSGPLEGTIRYSMVSTGFRTVLRKDTFNIRFQIIDRGLHGSNVAETGDITLDQLIR
ncbi:MAG: hypothetical protein ABJF04_03745 [Reichenbachiella sp.]|uniref:hypothetical protein n=1 Tax=Reichenbachiella sp. TaxID=2184521 RepID=UPI0032660F8A